MNRVLSNERAVREEEKTTDTDESHLWGPTRMQMLETKPLQEGQQQMEGRLWDWATVSWLETMLSNLSIESVKLKNLVLFPNRHVSLPSSLLMANLMFQQETHARSNLYSSQSCCSLYLQNNRQKPITQWKQNTSTGLWAPWTQNQLPNTSHPNVSKCHWLPTLLLSLQSQVNSKQSTTA